MTPSRSEAASRARRGPIVAAAALAALVLPLAPARAEVVVNEQEFRDWVGRCQTETNTGQVVCFIYTGRVAEVQGQTLAARIVVGIGDDLQPIVYLDVPDIAEPANGFMLQVDNQEPFSGRFATCSTGWCHTEAGGEIAQILVQQFRAGNRAVASFILEEKELRVDLPLSLLGFTAAYTQLVNIHEEARRAAEEAAARAQEEAAEEDAPSADEEATQAPEGAADEPEAAPAEEDEAAEPEAAPAQEDAAPEAPADEPAESEAPADGDADADAEPAGDAPSAEDAEPAPPADGAEEPAAQ